MMSETKVKHLELDGRCLGGPSTRKVTLQRNKKEWILKIKADIASDLGNKLLFPNRYPPLECEAPRLEVTDNDDSVEVVIKTDSEHLHGRGAVTQKCFGDKDHAQQIEVRVLSRSPLEPIVPDK